MFKTRSAWSRSSWLELVLVLVYGILIGRWIGLRSPAHYLEMFGLWLFIFFPMSTLFHEMGHAIAVRLLTRRPAEAVVGAGPRLNVRLGQITVRFGILPMQGPHWGFCRYDRVGVDWRKQGWISLAGPAASVLELLILLLLLPIWWHSSPLIRSVLTIGAGFQTLSVLTNLKRTPPRDRQGPVVVGRDGWSAREAFAKARAGVPVMGSRSQMWAPGEYWAACAG